MVEQVLIVEPFKRHVCENCGKKIHYQSKGFCRHCAGLRFAKKVQLKTRSGVKQRKRNWKYATLKVDRCPKCGEPGSLHKKAIRNGVQKIYHYYYVCHYAKDKHTKSPMRWHYVPVHWVTEMLVSIDRKPEDFEVLEEC